ncbi:MAG: transposase [Hyphomicrobiales bacterium]
MRAGVDAAIRELCSHRGWYLAALAVRTEHVHVVILAANVPPEQVLRELKARSTQELRRRGLARTDERIWSRHGSTRYLWSEEEVDRACGYVLEGQGPELKD